MLSVSFEKWHGLGNDFILIRGVDLPSDGPPAPYAQWCRRRRGIGADGVIIISDETEASVSMKVFNRDGSQPEICGNGIRCVVHSWAARHRQSHGTLAVETGAGTKDCWFTADDVTVDMGPAALTGPAGGPGPAMIDVVVGEAKRSGTAVHMGNPHLVLFAEDWPTVPPQTARRLEKDPSFPKGANISFASEPVGSGIDLTVWERGVGFTQACGSAACATVVAAVASGRVPPDESISVTLPGGVLTIRVSSDLSEVLMTGPAVFVLRGEVAL